MPQNWKLTNKHMAVVGISLAKRRSKIKVSTVRLVLTSAYGGRAYHLPLLYTPHLLLVGPCGQRANRLILNTLFD